MFVWKIELEFLPKKSSCCCSPIRIKAFVHKGLIPLELKIYFKLQYFGVLKFYTLVLLYSQCLCFKSFDTYYFVREFFYSSEHVRAKPCRKNDVLNVKLSEFFDCVRVNPYCQNTVLHEACLKFISL